MIAGMKWELRWGYLGLGLDADIERAEAGGENSCDPLTQERVEEIETGLRQSLETAPSLHDPYARLIYARAEQAQRVHHLSSSSPPLLFLFLLLLLSVWWLETPRRVGL